MCLVCVIKIKLIIKCKYVIVSQNRLIDSINYSNIKYSVQLPNA